MEFTSMRSKRCLTMKSPNLQRRRWRLLLQHDIRPWLLPGLNELAKRKEPLGMQDLEILGAEVALKVAAIRESVTTIRTGGGRRLASGSRDASNIDFTSVIERVFEIPGQFRLWCVVAQCLFSLARKRW
ncbi:hypothetical protein HD554DRAFT_679532 [Boletus coccyginus]|nr:hypothetical protein HD554DRAFT_679532 [Boletus coccyginus]